MDNQDKLYNSILDYINVSKGEQLQFKPSIDDTSSINKNTSKDNIDTQLQLIKKQKISQLNSQIRNICENIVFTLMGLDTQKFYAILERSQYWGLQMCIQQFIMNYYLYIKKNNRLKQFIIIHLPKIISSVKQIIQLEIIDKINLQDFTSNNIQDTNLNASLHDIQKQINQIIPDEQIQQQEEQDQKQSEQITDMNKIITMKKDILNNLRLQNKDLQQI